MPFPRPTLTGLRQQARAYYTARLKGAVLSLRRSVLGTSADVMAGLVNGIYGYLDWIIRQCFASTAEWDYLLIQGAEYDLYPTGPIASAGAAAFTGVNGAPIPAKLLLLDAAQNQYQTVAAGVIGGGVVPVKALAGGAAGNLAAGTTLTLAVALANVDPTATVADDGTGNGLTGGADAEGIDSFRARILARKRQPPQGGDNADYVGWATDNPGVTRAWTYPLNRGGGTVDLTFVMDGRDNIVPTPADVSDVQTAIDLERPVTDDCRVFSPTPSAVDFTIQGDFTDAVKSAITASLKDMFAADAVPGGAYNPDDGATFDGGLSFQEQIDPAVAAGAGAVPFHIIAPVADIAGAAGVLLVLGDITFEA